VFNTAGQRARGATVTIKGDGWQRSIMTNDEGLYGFSGLCAGTATLQAFLVDGKASPLVTVSLTGQNSLRADLSLVPGAIGAPTTTTSATTAPGQQSPQPTTAPQAEMPTTGFSGWLLAGGALLGALLLLSAGARRALHARDRSQNRN
jgi:hypothetical protein